MEKINRPITTVALQYEPSKTIKLSWIGLSRKSGGSPIENCSRDYIEDE